LRSGQLETAFGIRRANRPEIEALDVPRPTTLAQGLVCLFVMGKPVPELLFRSAPRLLEILLAFDLAELAGTEVVARVLILPVGSRLILCEASSYGAGRDTVAPPDLSAFHLIDKIQNRHPRSWLDVATGTGVVVLAGQQSVLASLGTDINDRALAFAQASSWLNGNTEACWRRGDVFGACEPNSSWQLITFNPPLVEIDEGLHDDDLPCYLAGAPGLIERFWHEVPEKVQFPRSLGLSGAFTLCPFSLGFGDRFCITHWRPGGADGLSVRAIAEPERPICGG
jgi:hypothetical protein